METEICFEKSKIEADDNHRKASILEKIETFEAELSKVVDGRVPIALTPERETGEAVLDSDSPLTWVSSICYDEGGLDLDSSPRTPKEDVFDPFAPGSDDLLLAPQVKKYAKESKINVARRLNFDSSIGVKDNVKEDDGVEIILQEEILLEKMYESFLDAIVSKQSEGILDEDLSEEDENCSGFKTPTKSKLLSGIAESCPGAPKKARPNSQKIDLGLCRKLEF